MVLKSGLATLMGKNYALINAALFLIHEYSHSFSYFAETPFSAGPINFLLSLWHAAQFALYKDFPLAISGS